MMFVFKSTDNMLYTCPDSYILDQKQQRVNWGDQLHIHQVYRKGISLLLGFQTISVGFNHEGSSGTSLDSTWSSIDKNKCLYEKILKSEIKTIAFDLDRVITFDLGPKHPRYFYSKTDLAWYIQWIYPCDNIIVN